MSLSVDKRQKRRTYKKQYINHPVKRLLEGNCVLYSYIYASPWTAPLTSSEDSMLTDGVSGWRHHCEAAPCVIKKKTGLCPNFTGCILWSPRRSDRAYSGFYQTTVFVWETLFTEGSWKIFGVFDLDPKIYFSSFDTMMFLLRFTQFFTHLILFNQV